MFDLNTWQSGSGGHWQNWSISNGTFEEVPGESVDCLTLSSDEISNDLRVKVFPNPSSDKVTVLFNNEAMTIRSHYLRDCMGNQIHVPTSQSNSRIELDLRELDSGIFYLVTRLSNGGLKHLKIVKM